MTRWLALLLLTAPLLWGCAVRGGPADVSAPAASAAASAPVPSPGPTVLPALPPGFGTVNIKGRQFTVELAETQEKQTLGLSWRQSMPRERGMLFVFPQEDYYSIWMRGMSFPLDIVWISQERRIVEIRHQVPAEPGKPENELTIYTPKSKGKYIIELNAGVASENDMQVGDYVEF